MEEKIFDLADLCGLISVIHRKTQIYLNQELKKYGLNSAEFVYLIHIREDEALSLKCLGDHLRMDMAQASRVVKSLEEKGMVTKLRSREDGRACEVKLTELGRLTRPKILKDLDAWINRITEDMAPEEIKPFIRRLGLIARNATILTEEK